MCGRAWKLHEKKGKRTRSRDIYIVISKFKNTDDGKKKIIRFSSSRGSQDEYTFTKDDLINIVTFDLNTSYQTRGKDVLHQTHGCPIGGFLSAIYANVKCAYDEFKFLREIKHLKKRVYGIRQMDDLILFISYKMGIIYHLSKQKN